MENNSSKTMPVSFRSKLKTTCFSVLLIFTILTLNAQSQDSVIKQIKHDFEYINREKSDDSMMMFERMLDYPFPDKLLMIKAVNAPYLGNYDLTECWPGGGDGERAEFIKLYFGKNRQLILLEQEISLWYPGDGGGMERRISYYFKNKELIFSYEKVYTDEGMIMVYIEPEKKNKLEMASQDEERYYYQDGKLLKQLRKHVAITYAEEDQINDGRFHAYLSDKSVRTPSQEINSYSNKNLQDLRAILKEIEAEWGYRANIVIGNEED